MRFLDKIPYPPLLVAAIILGLAPFAPEPHAVEKTRLLFSGKLSRPVDIFDLFFHLAPAIILMAKWAKDLIKRVGKSQ